MCAASTLPLGLCETPTEICADGGFPSWLEAQGAKGDKSVTKALPPQRIPGTGAPALPCPALPIPTLVPAGTLRKIPPA